MEDKIEQLLKTYKKEQEAFENHWLWRKLNTTPKEFFAKVRLGVERSGISKKQWQEKLTEMKKVFATRSRERAGMYQTVNFKNVRGLRV